MRHKTPKISIISPVYNSENFIHKYIDSILSQTFQDWELILVNDGSTDNSGKICDKYVGKDARIKVTHKPNGGVASARQCGMEAAIGEYIIHADPDDWVEPTMLEQLYIRAKEKEADIVICDYYVNYDNKQVRVLQRPTEETANGMLRDLFHRLHGSLWNKLVKRVCYIEYGVRFISNINYCEDMLIWVQLLQHDMKVTYWSEAFYHYVQHSGSITNHCTPMLYDNAKRYIEALKRLLPDNFANMINKVEVSHHFGAWKDGVITSKEFHQSARLSKICRCDMPIRNKCACLLAFAQCDKIAKWVLSLKIHLHKQP